jgi:hypothetical protein
MAQVADDATMQLMAQQAGVDRGASNLTVRFTMEAEQQMEESEKQGRPIFKEVEYVTIWVDKDNVNHRPVRYYDKILWPDQYKAFKNNQEQPQAGTFLDSLPYLSKAQVAELNAHGVKTAEQLVALPDSTGQKIMAFQNMKQRTQRFLDALAGAAPAQKLAAELEQRDSQIRALQQALQEQGEKIEKMARKKE